MHKGKLLIGLPVCQDHAILHPFLLSLKKLHIPDCTVYYHFIDDNHDPVSQALLEQFRQDTERVTVERLPDMAAQPYISHQWTQAGIWKVAAYKDRLIARALREEFDYLFFVDSDILLHPETVDCLIQAEKEIIAEVFWTKWQPDIAAQPQVWLSDVYTQYPLKPGENITAEEKTKRIYEFYDMLRKPGVYEVGGLGACTLIQRSALEKGVSFQRIKNVSFWGEDRHFCVRANALGIDLFADTHYPPYHIFRHSELPGGLTFLQNF